MQDSTNDFSSIWVVHFDCDHQPGERLVPTALEAREMRTGREVKLTHRELQCLAQPPWSTGTDTLFVCYDGSKALGCHLALGWPLPSKILDLHAEFRRETAGLLDSGDYDLLDAFAYFGLDAKRLGTLEALALLLKHIESKLQKQMQFALIRGRYMKAVAHMQWAGIPLDVESLNRLKSGWENIRDTLVRQVDVDYGVYDGNRFSEARFTEWLQNRGISWSKHISGKLDLSKDVFRDMAKSFPSLYNLKELRLTLSQLRPCKLAVGKDGRNRFRLRPFASKTGRNQPRNSEFIFGYAKWMRGLIRPEPGKALAYLDFASQETGIAAALSGDQTMQQAYNSGDFYLDFAHRAGIAEELLPSIRAKFKLCVLGVQYGMGIRSLAHCLGSQDEARRLIGFHKHLFPKYWKWSNRVEKKALAEGFLQSAYGWQVRVGQKPNTRSLRNFPLQANAADILRMACIALADQGVTVCTPVHDALLVEASANAIDEIVAICRETMEKASALVLGGFQLKTTARVLRCPDRLLEDKSKKMWDTVFHLLNSEIAHSE